jgi:hypothetical protein
MNVEINESALVRTLEVDNRNFIRHLRQEFNGGVSVAMPLIKIYISQLRQIYKNSNRENFQTVRNSVGDILEGLYQLVGKEGRQDLSQSGLIGY